MKEDPNRRFVRLGDEWFNVAAIRRVAVEDQPERLLCVYDVDGQLIGKFPPLYAGELLELMDADELLGDAPWRHDREEDRKFQTFERRMKDISQGSG